MVRKRRSTAPIENVTAVNNFAKKAGRLPNFFFVREVFLFPSFCEISSADVIELRGSAGEVRDAVFVDGKIRTVGFVCCIIDPSIYIVIFCRIWNGGIGKCGDTFCTFTLRIICVVHFSQKFVVQRTPFEIGSQFLLGFVAVIRSIGIVAAVV